MGRGVDLNEVDGAVGCADHPKLLVPDDQAADVLIELLQVGVDLPVLLGCTESDAEAGRAYLRDSDPVCDAAQLQVDGAPDLVPCLGPAAVCGGEEVQAFGLLLLLVGLDRSRDERDPRVPFGSKPTLPPDPVDPPGVGAPVDDLGLLDLLDQEALVRRAAFDEDCGVCLLYTSPSPRDRTRSRMP